MNEKLLEIARKAQELEKLIESTPECIGVEISPFFCDGRSKAVRVMILKPDIRDTPDYVVTHNGREHCYLYFGNSEFTWLRECKK